MCVGGQVGIVGLVKSKHKIIRIKDLPEVEFD